MHDQNHHKNSIFYPIFLTPSVNPELEQRMHENADTYYVQLALKYYNKDKKTHLGLDVT
jgi:hypothetical protein